LTARAIWIPGLLVAVGAAVATAHGLFEVAAAAGVPLGLAWLYPLITDGLALVAYAATARLDGGARRGTRRFATGMRAMSASVTRTTARVPRAADVGGIALVRRPAGAELVDIALQVARAEELPMDPPAAGRAWRPGAEHSRPQCQGCFASLRDGLRPPLTPSLRGRASRSYGGGDSARHLYRATLASEATMTDRTTLPPADRSDWRSRAACRDVEPDTFFPATDRGPEVGRAKAVCAGCPVRNRCLDEALRQIPEGIAGGLTAAERRSRLHSRPQHIDPNELARTARTRTENATAGRLLLASGRSRAAVARTCRVSERTVYRWSASAQASASPAGVAL